MLLIDLDPVLYACGFAAQESRHTLVCEDSDGNVSEHYTTQLATWKRANSHLTVLSKETEIAPKPEREAEVILRQALGAIAAPGEHRWYLTSGAGNFREEVATLRPYKGNRDKSQRPHHYKFLRQLALKLAHVDVAIGMEADDAISIAAHSGFYGTDYVVVSIDKDLDQIPGRHWNYTKTADPAEGYTVDETAALRQFVKQWLVGDATDNIKGLDGIGAAKGEKLLASMPKTRPEIRDWVFDLYGDAGIATEVARLVYLLKKPTQIWDEELWTRGKI